MTKHLLVGIGEAANMSELRIALATLLRDVTALGVRSQVAVFDHDADTTDLEAVADVIVLDDLRERTPARRLQSAAERFEGSLARTVLDARTRSGRSALREPDVIHLFGITGVPVLDYLPEAAARVTAYVHPWETAISGLPRRDRELLATRVERFLVAEPAGAEPLLAAGIGPDAIVDAPAPEAVVPDLPPSVEAVHLARAALGIPSERPVVAIPPVTGWAELPDLTLGVAWELERLGGPDAPTVLWYGMPEPGSERWPIEDDLHRSGIGRLLLHEQPLEWDLVVDVADAVALPVAAARELPEGFAERAARRTTPLLCWEGDPHAEEVARWTGTVVPRGDVEAMAGHLWDAVRNDAALRAARTPTWDLLTEELHRLLPLGIPVP